MGAQLSAQQFGAGNYLRFGAWERSKLQRSFANPSRNVVMWVRSVALEPTSLQPEGCSEAVKFIQRLSHQMAPKPTSPPDAFVVNINSHTPSPSAPILHIIRKMRNNITPREAAEIGARVRAARLLANKSLVEIGCAIGVHHSQVSRCERGAFKTASKNVQKLCEFLQITHPKLERGRLPDQVLKERFEALLKAVPESASTFCRLFDLLEASTRGKAAPKSARRGRSQDSSAV